MNSDASDQNRLTFYPGMVSIRIGSNIFQEDPTQEQRILPTCPQSFSSRNAPLLFYRDSNTWLARIPNTSPPIIKKAAKIKRRIPIITK